MANEEDMVAEVLAGSPAPVRLEARPVRRLSAAPVNEVTSPVLITCPQTGEPVETVLRLRPSAFEGLSGEYRFRCSRCGQVHAWSKDEAWLKPSFHQ